MSCKKQFLYVEAIGYLNYQFQGVIIIPQYRSNRWGIHTHICTLYIYIYTRFACDRVTYAMHLIVNGPVVYQSGIHMSYSDLCFFPDIWDGQP